MSRLEHVNLVVPDISPTLEFLKCALPDWRVRGEGTSEWYGRPRKWLHFGTDDFYITLNEPADGQNRDLRGHAAGLAHIGIEVTNSEAVAARLKQAGYLISTIGADHPHRRTIYFFDPAGFEFEFIEYFSDDPAAKNMYGGETSTIQRVASA
jgi:catechol 2,3-dioxygenase-like lactoylglutathione lyase family enzyme